MHEQTLRDFFEGCASARALADDLIGSLQTSGGVTRHAIIDMNEEFAVTPEHLIRVCDAVIGGVIAPEYLRAIGFCLQASDKFVWDGSEVGGERVAEVAADWSAPEINFPLTLANAAAWRRYLTGGEYQISPSGKRAG
jgi:hypothetical protein